MSDVRGGAFDDLLDAIEMDEGYYLSCPNDHGVLPPQRICPDCGARTLTETPLPEIGEIVTYTTVSVPLPRFSEDNPYIIAIADFGPVRLTGQLRGVAPEDVSLGAEITPSIAQSETSGERLLVFDRYEIIEQNVEGTPTKTDH